MSPNRTPHRSHRTLRVESLERREVMSASPLMPPDVQALLAPAAVATPDATMGPIARLQSTPASPVVAPAGTIDTSFGDNGVWRHNVSERFGSAEKVLLLSDGSGRFLIGGTEGRDLVITRHFENGALDPSFGTRGVVRISVAGDFECVNDLIELSDGQILAAGSGNHDFVLIRLKADGEIDTKFGTRGTGYELTNIDNARGPFNWGPLGEVAERGEINREYEYLPEGAYVVKIVEGGKILVGGSGGEDFALVRYHANGEIDKTFGTRGTGIEKTNIGGHNEGIKDMVIVGDKIIVVGSGGDDFAIAQYDLNGRIDQNFGVRGTGWVRTNFSGHKECAESVLILPDGKILVAGSGGEDLALARYSANGILDTSFGVYGKVQTNISSNNEGACKVLLVDGKILVVGSAGGSSAGDFVVARYDYDGTLDKTFNKRGFVRTNISGSLESANDAVVLPGGKLLVVGAGGEDFAAVRYNIGDAPDKPIEPSPKTHLAIVSVGSTKINEGGPGEKTVFKYRITRSGDTSVETTVSYQVAGAGETPASADDFIGSKFPTGKRTFAAKETTKEITIEVAGDKVVELDENFTVTLLDASADAEIVTAAAEGTIANEDKPLPQQAVLAIKPGSVVADEGNTGTTTYRFQVTQSNNMSNGTTVKWSVTGHGADGTDFVGGNLPSGILTFAAGDTKPQYIEIEVAGDTTVESDEQFIVTLTAPGAVITTPSAKGTIKNDDQDPPITTVVGGLLELGPGITISASGQLNITGREKTSNHVVVQGSDNNPIVTMNGQTFNITALLAARRAVIENWLGKEEASRLYVTRIDFRGGSEADHFENRTNISVSASGSGGRDTLIGGGGNDDLCGGFGDDILYGGSGDDQLVGDSGSRTDHGSDQLHGGDGNDRLDGGNGRDWLYGDDGEDTLRGGDGADHLEGGHGNDKHYGGDGDDTIVATDGMHGNDVVAGQSGKNTVVDDPSPKDLVPEVTINKQGRVLIQGTSASDNVSVNMSGKDFVVTFNGREQRFAAASVKTLEFRGGNGNDTFTNNTSIASAAYGEQGDDRLIGGSGRDLLRGGAGQDWLEGRAANDALYGDVGNDTMQGGDGDDQLFGGDGDDHLDGSAGSDTLEGGQGNDGMYGGDGRDFLFGQEGNDWLYGGAGNDELYGLLGNDRIYGDDGDDKLRGARGNDILFGGAGNDDLDGDEDDDTLYGEEGNDRLVSRDGKAGNDKLYDWLGANVFDALMVEIELQAANKVVAKKR